MKEYVMNEIYKSLETKKRMLDDEKIICDIASVAEICIKAYRNGKKIITCGNGGSASDAMHFVGELVGRYRLDREGINAICLNSNVVNMTALANDFSYESMFERQLTAVGSFGDILFGLSTSGNSAIVNNAFRKAKDIGITTIGLLGRDGGLARELCDRCIVVPSQITSNIQEAHILIIHVIAGLIENEMFSKNNE